MSHSSNEVSKGEEWPGGEVVVTLLSAVFPAASLFTQTTQPTRLCFCPTHSQGWALEWLQGSCCRVLALGAWPCLVPWARLLSGALEQSWEKKPTSLPKQTVATWHLAFMVSPLKVGSELALFANLRCVGC